MTTFCNTCDIPYTNICDFCCFYCFNGEWDIRRGGWVSVYIDTGFCYVDMLPRDPEEACDEFYCFGVKNMGNQKRRVYK